jgi:membrane fusion protein, multidrug efflux system
MPTEKSQSADKGAPNSIPPAGEAAAAAADTNKPQTGILSEENAQKPITMRRLVMGGTVILGLVVLALFGIPWIKFILTTVSTDDAYVNGHVTFVAARVPGQVSKVLVDDNNRVNKGDLLVELDREPYLVEVALKKAAVNTAKADLDAAKANVRGVEARARSQRWKLQHAIEDVETRPHSFMRRLPRSIRARPR